MTTSSKYSGLMTIEDFNTTNEVVSEAELESVLDLRYGAYRANLFWLFPGPLRYPSLAIHLKGELAVLNYFPEERNAGFVSMGMINELDARSSTIFVSNATGEIDEIPNSQIVPSTLAYAAAKEFFRSPIMLPPSIRWFEL